MPRHDPRPLPRVDEILEELRGHGVADAPTEGPEDALAGLLWLALGVAERQKRVSFPAFSWEDPGFVSVDAKVRMDVRYTRFEGSTREDLRDALLASLPRLRGSPHLLGLDCRASALREFEMQHALYGEVTLSSWPHRPAESADPRIHDAMEKGWAKTLKENNLVPGRGIVVLDEHQGLLLREPALAALQGILVLPGSTDSHVWWNPFARAADADLQYWLSWGPGAPSSYWKEVLRHGGEG